MSLLCITLDNSSVAVSAKTGTSLSLLSENYNIDFYFLINFRRQVAVFCYLSSSCLWLPKWRSRLCKVKASQDQVDPQGESTLQSSPWWRELRKSTTALPFPHATHLHMVLSLGREGKEMIFLQEPHAIQGWAQVTGTWKAPAYFRLMSLINTVLKTFLETEYGSTEMWDTYEQNTGKVAWDSIPLLRKCWGKERESMEILIKWQHAQIHTQTYRVTWLLGLQVY